MHHRDYLVPILLGGTAAEPWYKTEAFWGIVGALGGVLIGFALTELTAFFKQKKKSKQIKAMIRSELISIKCQLQQKKLLAEQIGNSLSELKIQSGITLPTPSIAYRQYLPEIHSDLSILEINCLQSIYEHAFLNDKLMAEFEKEIAEDLLNKVAKDPIAKHIQNMKDIVISYEQMERWIDSYLEGKPIDVMQIEKILKNPGKKWIGVNMKSPNVPPSKEA